MTFAITSFLILFICSLGAGEGLPSEKLMVSYQQLLLTFSENTQVFFKYNLTLYWQSNLLNSLTFPTSKFEISYCVVTRSTLKSTNHQKLINWRSQLYSHFQHSLVSHNEVFNMMVREVYFENSHVFIFPATSSGSLISFKVAIK